MVKDVSEARRDSCRLVSCQKFANEFLNRIAEQTSVYRKGICNVCRWKMFKRTFATKYRVHLKHRISRHNQNARTNTKQPENKAKQKNIAIGLCGPRQGTAYRYSEGRKRSQPPVSRTHLNPRVDNRRPFATLQAEAVSCRNNLTSTKERCDCICQRPCSSPRPNKRPPGDCDAVRL